jgi:hypothetical protein
VQSARPAERPERSLTSNTLFSDGVDSFGSTRCRGVSRTRASPRQPPFLREPATAVGTAPERPQEVRLVRLMAARWTLVCRTLWAGRVEWDQWTQRKRGPRARSSTFLRGRFLRGRFLRGQLQRPRSHRVQKRTAASPRDGWWNAEHTAPNVAPASAGETARHPTLMGGPLFGGPLSGGIG